MANKLHLQLALLFIVMLFAGTAFAIPCGTGSLEDSTACRDGYSQVDSENYLNGVGGNQSSSGDPLATAAFFGINDWNILTKIEEGTDGVIGTSEGSIDLIVSSEDKPLSPTSGIGALSGSWSFDPNIWNYYSSILIVMKGGKGEDVQGDYDVYWSAYLLEKGTSSGTWDFTNPDPENSLSHMTVYGGAPVPEPATMLLFGTGIIGLAGVIRKKRK